MNVVFLGGSHPRHFYIASKLYEAGFLKGMVVEERGMFVQPVPEGLNEQDKNNFIYHFEQRDKAEEKLFGNVDIPKLKDSVACKQIQLSELNSKETEEFIRGLEPDVLLSFGVHKLEDNILNLCPGKAFNIHGGLSPWYRGCITMFWPFYFLRPNWAGTTIHHLSNRMDGGDIVHQVVPALYKGDKLQEVGARAIEQTGIELPKLMQMLAEGKELPCVKQGTTGKLFVALDWTPQHLRLVYNTFNDDIVDRYLAGDIVSPAPNLVRAFE